MKSSAYDLAMQLALHFHSGQMYGEDEPYHTHIAEVVVAVQDLNKSDDRLPVIAFLHDILEDTVCTEDVLTALFDHDVVLAVIALTKHRAETKEEYLARCKSHPLARQVKMADSFCNLRASMKRLDMKRVQKYGGYLAFLAAP